ncbi:RHS repeat-associated core domain-containing protein [Candidatus Woesearchaeota archaeon]|nr:RHS repeat-associated core domain-containing protein [Candidatus Woesearchaeota archaeon]
MRWQLLSIFLTLIVITAPFALAQEISLSYDANGNLLADENNLYSYNGLNQLVSVRENGGGRILETYAYDDAGGRIKKVYFRTDGSNETTYYVNDNFIRVVNSSGTFDTVFYFHNGQRVARKDFDGKMFFYHPDHLGSTDLVTDESGKKVEKTSYMPFGEVLSGGESRFTFTGKEMDKGTGLMYYGARYYNPSFKRFTQPDSVIADVYDPQNLNRYSYVMNNPVKYTDPSGNAINLIGAAVAGGIGFAIGALWSAGNQYFSKGEIDWWEAGKSGAAVGIAAGVGVLTLGLGLAALGPAVAGGTGAQALGYTSYAVGGVAGQVTSNLLTGTSTLDNTPQAAITGMVLGYAIGGDPSSSVAAGWKPGAGTTSSETGTNIVGTTYSEYIPTQEKMFSPVVNQYKADILANKYVPPAEAISVIGMGSYISDGHHRIIAWNELGVKPQVNTVGRVWPKDLQNTQWRDVSISQTDWKLTRYVNEKPTGDWGSGGRPS